MKSPNPIDRHVGARVRMRRMTLGLSQTELATGLGLTFQQVQKYEKGTNRIGASRLQQIAGILQVPVSFFFEGLPAPGDCSSGADTVTRMLSMPHGHGVALAEAFLAIGNSKDRHVLIEVAEALARQSAQIASEAA